jgi:hypothetical protein
VQAAGILSTAGLVPWLQFGEVLHWFFSERMSMQIGFASFAAPISIGTQSPHNLATGQAVVIAGVEGNTAANGTWPVVVVDSTHFTLTGSSGNGAYVPGTGTASGGGMAFYDANQTAAAVSALGRALADFWTQDDDPTLNAGDVTFLQGRIKSHIDTISAAVLASYSGAKFELLFPYDVAFPQCYYTTDLPFPQGGRLNGAVNLPAQYMSQSGSGLDRLKMEALSWGATYRNVDNAKAAIAFPPPLVTGVGWPLAQTGYLVPVFNGGCPWPDEYVAARNAKLPLINLWALDHLTLLSWKVQPMPVPATGA